MAYKVTVLIFIMVGGLLFYTMRSMVRFLTVAISMWLAAYLISVVAAGSVIFDAGIKSFVYYQYKIVGILMIAIFAINIPIYVANRKIFTVIHHFCALVLQLFVVMIPPALSI
ncbi:hypothetical protein [Oceanidesulfovibrio marinus]|uniref:Uncharacterized protein n=1 Tax=Oceanidesulfovibrio marinus TaxID=370038 RepID=A0ABX6NCI8_9BACT|nr:hypothetical protein [Oceanidesulfovibrio marinus]QJT08061.1 hypothetical protein E8L03_03580 [Oceanidesulfovibrio marinus]